MEGAIVHGLAGDVTAFVIIQNRIGKTDGILAVLVANLIAGLHEIIGARPIDKQILLADARHGNKIGEMHADQAHLLPLVEDFMQQVQRRRIEVNLMLNEAIERSGMGKRDKAGVAQFNRYHPSGEFAGAEAPGGLSAEFMQLGVQFIARFKSAA